MLLLNRAFQAQIATQSGHYYRIEVSTNLVTWDYYGLIKSVTNAVQVVDLPASGPANRFYRAIWVQP